MTSKAHTRAEVEKLARRHAVQVKWADLGPDEAGNTYGDKITLDVNMDHYATLSAFFHELGHAHCYRNGIFRDYHEPDLFERTSKYCDWKKGLEIERWVDKWAEQQARADAPQLGRIFQSYWDNPLRDSKKVLESAMPQVCKRRKNN